MKYVCIVVQVNCAISIRVCSFAVVKDLCSCVQQLVVIT